MSGSRSVRVKENKAKASNGDGQQSTSANDQNEMIRQAAYQKWEAAGCPDSDGVEFWLAAEAELTSSNRPSKPR